MVFILLDTLKTAFRMRNLNHRWKQSCQLLPKTRQFLTIFKKGLEGFPSLLAVPVGYFNEIQKKKIMLCIISASVSLKLFLLWTNFNLHVLIKFFLQKRATTDFTAILP